ncbi:diguanylate cyclase/phosphodiesterase [Roseibium hamelinense]|uniref:Diguanylate cyclase/phosphodiesterase n=1 Tax=Roseibium hamelinense TaxID=150831 RepID=A0A562TB41_9HYPH|nr:EAL domain-containing protein [Roseibium hamelinense]MTI45123.1 EAL domain-containing protein [Roseibium hamelinense]TWI90518.1 diguanylate cyclase/phosphodiesterase [Roseibium hamelinense]
MTFKVRSLNSLVFRVTAILVTVVTLSIVLISSLGYLELYNTAEEHASIRVDRAGRTAATALYHAYSGQFEIERDDNGRPVRIRLTESTQADILSYTDAYDRLLADIGQANQGAANLFRYNEQTRHFDRFATTFRKPDGSLPPPMSITGDHPAYSDLANGVMHVGEVPVMGRQRLAYLTPIVTAENGLAGALAVDVGWADDLKLAEETLQNKVLTVSALILALAGVTGIVMMRREMHRIRRLAGYANAVAAGEDPGDVPYTKRGDDVGHLAQGLAKVIDLREKLETLAFTDPVTGCGNRAKYLHDLTAAVDRAKIGERTALVHMDIDGFAKVNDAFGQQLGDRVLEQTSKRLKQGFGPHAKIARLSGDDFCILLPLGHDESQAARRVNHALDLLSQPIVLPEAEVYVEPAMGITLLPDDGPDADTAHRKTCLALRAAKSELSPRFSFFSEHLNARAQRELALEGMLRDALRTGALTLHYQPQVCLRRMCLKGFEALARWPQKDGGYIPPSDFIPIAEKTGLIVELGNWVLDQSCRQAKEWRDEGLSFDYVSVNVSPIQIWQPNFEHIVQASLSAHDLPPNCLVLEVTENVFVGHDENRVLDVLRRIRELGVLLSLDDFGSGYSSLSYLNRLPFGQLKIDRAFVAGIDLDVNKVKLLKGMVNLAHTLGLKVIAEGAEEAPEVSIVRELGCDGIQGFYFGRPAPAEEIRSLMDNIVTLAPAFNTKHLQSTG